MSGFYEDDDRAEPPPPFSHQYGQVNIDEDSFNTLASVTGGQQRLVTTFCTQNKRTDYEQMMDGWLSISRKRATDFPLYLGLL